MFRFDAYTLDVARGCLRSGEREVELRPKSFDVLRYLVENAGRLVSKDEIIKAVWPNVTVTDESLTQCVSEVRRAIGNGNQDIIKTVPRRGYRFTAPVSQIGADSQAAPQQAAAERPRVDLDVRRPLASSTQDRPCIAVLPFVNLSGDPEQEYFSDGITEDIITELSRFSELLVIARNSTFQYKGKAVDIRQIGRELGARYVLEGSIRRSGNHVRTNAQLIDAVTGSHRWADRYDRELRDAFAVQDEVARTIVGILAAHVNKAEAERTLLKPAAAWEAHDYYLRGAEAFLVHARERTAETLYETRRLLEQSLSIGRCYARTYALLSRTYMLTFLEPLDDDYLNTKGLDRAHALAMKAVQLDGNLPMAHSHLGWVLINKRLHDDGLAEFQRAASLNPNFTDYLFGHGLVMAGQSEKAIEALHANLRTDPFENPARFAYMGHGYYMLKRHADAVQPLRECASRMPNFRIVHVWLAAAHAQLGQFAEAKREAAEILRIEPNFTIDRWKCTAPYKNQKDAEHLFDGLRKAGLLDC